MNSLLFLLACAVLVLVVAAKIPGIEYFVKPIVDLVFTGVKVSCEYGASWVVWMTKLLLSSHSDLVRHLFMSAEDIDPSREIRENEA